MRLKFDYTQCKPAEQMKCKYWNQIFVCFFFFYICDVWMVGVRHHRQIHTYIKLNCIVEGMWQSVWISSSYCASWSSVLPLSNHCEQLLRILHCQRTIVRRILKGLAFGNRPTHLNWHGGEVNAMGRRNTFMKMARLRVIRGNKSI